METWERLLLISAWNDSGGAYTHRLFDSHPELYCWPFEIQLGTTASEGLEFPWLKGKFRWPVFASPMAAPQDFFDQILDTELKGRLQDPATSKFRELELRVSLAEWRQRFCLSLGHRPTVGEVVRCYIKSFFEADHDYQVTGRERGIVGHCPNLVVDAQRILADFPEGRILHIVRCPLAGIVDMRRRNPGLSAQEYGDRWNAINKAAALLRRKYPTRIRTISLQRLLTDPRAVMSELCQWLDVAYNGVLLRPTWRGQGIELPGPFGGLSAAGMDHEYACVRSLAADDRTELLACTVGARELLDFEVLTGFDTKGVGVNGAS